MRSLSLNRSVLFPLIFLSSCFFQLSVTDWRCKVAAEGHIKAARGSDSSSSHGRLQTPERGRTLMKRTRSSSFLTPRVSPSSLTGDRNQQPAQSRATQVQEHRTEETRTHRYVRFLFLWTIFKMEFYLYNHNNIDLKALLYYCVVKMQQ